MAYAAGGAALAVAITVAVTGTFVPHEWSRAMVGVTLWSAAVLALGLAVTFEQIR